MYMYYMHIQMVTFTMGTWSYLSGFVGMTNAKTPRLATTTTKLTTRYTRDKHDVGVEG